MFSECNSIRFVSIQPIRTSAFHQINFSSVLFPDLSLRNSGRDFTHLLIFAFEVPSSSKPVTPAPPRCLEGGSNRWILTVSTYLLVFSASSKFSHHSRANRSIIMRNQGDHRLADTGQGVKKNDRKYQLGKSIYIWYIHSVCDLHGTKSDFFWGYRSVIL